MKNLHIFYNGGNDDKKYGYRGQNFTYYRRCCAYFISFCRASDPLGVDWPHPPSNWSGQLVSGLFSIQVFNNKESKKIINI
jgi:hypothetical protein